MGQKEDKIKVEGVIVKALPGLLLVELKTDIR